MREKRVALPNRLPDVVGVQPFDPALDAGVDVDAPGLGVGQRPRQPDAPAQRPSAARANVMPRRDAEARSSVTPESPGMFMPAMPGMSAMLSTARRLRGSRIPRPPWSGRQPRWHCDGRE